MSLKNFEAWLRTSNAYDFVDDAVLGSLTDNEVIEVMQDFDLDFDNKEHRSQVSQAINQAIQEGH